MSTYYKRSNSTTTAFIFVQSSTHLTWQLPLVSEALPDRSINLTTCRAAELIKPLAACVTTLRDMAFSPSLTPSRPAPVPPRRAAITAPYIVRVTDASAAPQSNFSATSYSPSFSYTNSSIPSTKVLDTTRSRTIRSGAASIKEEGLRAFMWSKRWLVLGSAELRIYKNEVRILGVLNHRFLLMKHRGVMSWSWYRSHRVLLHPFTPCLWRIYKMYNE